MPVILNNEVTKDLDQGVKQQEMEASGIHNRKGKGGLGRLFLSHTVLPLIILGIFIVVLGYVMYMHGLQTEVERGLGSVARTVLATYDMNYPGDYNLLTDEKNNVAYLRKGDVILEDTAFIDEIKRETGIDITIFFYNMRMLTTITDEKGERVTMTLAHDMVVDKVLKRGTESFFSRVIVGGNSYFVEYVPFFSKTGVCLGMIAAAKPSDEVARLVNNAVLSNTMLIIAGIILVVVIMRRCTMDIVRVLGKMSSFLGDISEGNLSTQLDDVVFSRQDEIGDMARFTVHVQGSLRKLIERDALTGIYNRRSGAMRMHRIIDDGRPYCVAMADIDYFKKVNDTYGHDAGDEVLKCVARLLSDTMRKRGFAARWGGEEFLMIFENMEIEESTAVLYEILDQIRKTQIDCTDVVISVTMSIGIATGEIGGDMDVQLKKSDDALYYAKSHGRDRIIRADFIPGDDESVEVDDDRYGETSTVPGDDEDAPKRNNVRNRKRKES